MWPPSPQLVSSLNPCVPTDQRVTAIINQLTGKVTRLGFLSVRNRRKQQGVLSMSKINPAEFTENHGHIGPRYTFDNFVVASNNESCVLAAQRVVEQPGEACNPFYIYGAKGLGKTHLMHAMANALIAKGCTSIVCKSAERFVTDLIAAIRDGVVQAFHHQYQHADALMLDDIHFIAGKTSTEKELLCVFNALYDLKKQIVLTSHVPPDAFAALSASMCSRFTSSLVTKIKTPNML